MMSPAVMYFWRAIDVLEEGLFGHVGGKGIVRHVGRQVHRQVFRRLFQQVTQTLDFAHRLLVGFRGFGLRPGRR